MLWCDRECGHWRPLSAGGTIETAAHCRKEEMLVLIALGSIAVVVLSPLLVLVAYIWSVHRKYQHIPSPKGASFFTGHYSQLSKDEEKEESELCPLSRSIQQWSEEVGQLFVIFILWKPLVITMNAEDVKELETRKDVRKSDRMLSLQTLMGQRFLGLSVMTIRDYGPWKPLRTMQSPAFTESYLTELIPLFNESAEQFVKKLMPFASIKKQVMMRDQMYEIALFTIFKVALSVDINDVWKGQSKNFPWAKDKALIDLFNLANDAILEDIKTASLYRYIHPFKAMEYHRVARALRATARVVLQRRMKDIQDGADVPRDLMSNVMKTELLHGVTDVEKHVDTMLSYVIGELETVGNTLTFAIVLLCSHPQVMDRLMTEITEVFGNKQSLDEQDVEKLQFTEQVIMETQRLYPAIAGVTKESPGLDLRGHHIPKGATIYLDCNNSCRLPQNFDDPNTFDPSRFDPSKKRPSPFVYFPFSAGHRSCIGRQFALMEGKIILSKLLQSYQIKLPPDYKFIVSQHTTLRTKDALPCTLELKR